jgi:hypothetical protein
MSNEEHTVSKRLREVWQWKEATYREVAHLPTDQALAEILEKARRAAETIDLPRRSPLRTFSPREG